MKYHSSPSPTISPMAIARQMRARGGQRGSTLLLTLFFSSLFLVMFGATLSYIMAQHRAVQQEVWNIQSLYTAETGAQYYRWHLAHDPDDYAEDTGLHTFTDPQGGDYGTYDISVDAPGTGSTTAIITVNGSSVLAPQTVQRVRVRYGRPSLAHYAFMTNSNVWFGNGESISGEVHSNGGVRMDGIGTSILSSAQETYLCGSEHGCSDEIKDGVWGTGVDSSFWEFPVEQFDFDSLTVDLEQMKVDAQSGGIYLGDSGAHGYFVAYASDGTVTINRVNNVYSAVNGYNGTEWTSEANSKRNWSVVSGYNGVALPSNGIIFLEDDVWVSGNPAGHSTVVAARLPEGSYTEADIYIQEDIVYTTRDGSDALGLIAQQDILVPLRSEDDLEINAAMLAVNGHAFRYYYPSTWGNPYSTYAIRDRIETYGSLISNTNWTWSWTSGGGATTSGYEVTETTYDSNLLYGPPPSFPTEDEYQFISWEHLELNE